MSRRLLVAACLVASSACTETTGTGTNPTPITPPSQQIYSVTGTISSAAGGGLSNATVRIEDGGSAGKTANTDGSGRYTLDNVAFGGFTIGVTAPGYVRTSRGITLVVTQPSFTANFALLPEALWTRSGTGNTVFDMPTYFPRVRIQGSVAPRGCQNFIVHIGTGSNRFVVNEIIGECSIADSVTYDAIHLSNNGGVTEIVSSNGVSWTFTESR